jgi:branched-chain amino acid transport system permease protein
MSRISNLLGNTVLIGCLLFAALLAAPKFLSMYGVLILTEILIMSLFAMSFNILFGYSGLLSFGQAGFFGAGGYFAVWTLLYFSDSIWPALIAGFVGAAILSVVIGWLCVKLDEIYFAILTLGFGMMLFTIAHDWRSITGGSDGLGGFTIPNLDLFGWEAALANPKVYYYFVLLVAAVGALVLMRVVKSPYGLLLTATRENQQRVSFVGANVRTVRLYAFVLAGAMAGVAGVLFALFNRIASPEMLHWSFSGRAVLMTILGGSGVFLGPAVGAAVFFILEHYITSYTGNWMIFLGAILVLLVLVFPRGVLGTVVHYLSRAGPEVDDG